jgi:oxygen-independent coproporphyrinogen-3 oxidase
VRKCPYCDFNSHAIGRDPVPGPAYVEALIQDLEQDLPRVWGRHVRSVFIGGGTPSLLTPEAIGHLLSALRARLPLVPGCEITLEANPGTVDAGRFRGFREAGVTRLSIGVQSFDDGLLGRIGRIHTGADGTRAVESALAAGFDAVNLDLMYGLPGQTTALALADVERAIALGPAHISLYQLTLEPNTPFYHDPPALPVDDDLAAMDASCRAMLDAAGYGRYEVSAYARADARCRHNLNYWEFGDYLGIGAGAHGKITHGGTGRVERLTKRRHPRDYTGHGNDYVSRVWSLGDQDLVLEFMMNALRLTRGFPEDLFPSRTGLPFDRISPTLALAEVKGLVERQGGLIRPTPTGLTFLNDLLSLFVPAPEAGVHDQDQQVR